ncbi:ferric-dicitrate binding protein FerR (iron transport regulator) [Chitinophaga terrae (ex Kim and Jung 2007)]|uniref:FecR family protein n=1 Tax=Chitinophaga terrae (ex Kim and Jung 2007) TaxID=408074 RepID=UPI0027824D41|nr:FecR domain-containing protein [Chitinophaga terrae (ex Kim and Jung 2007)]MDQ0107504.1 ferric-dicitrate binding protein FerR (iron transport regulator) [Chitinophaga terrae (ex Kim and Jung 2007)]
MDNLSRTELFLTILSGKATPEQEAIADSLKKTDPDARREWEELNNFFTQEEVKKRYDQMNVEADYRKFRRSLSRKHRYGLAAAATILILMIAGGLYFYQRGRVQPPVSKDLVTIKLGASGKELVLSDTATIDVKGATIHAQGDQVAFRSNGNASTDLNILSVPRAKRYSVRLQDGTFVKLNSETTIRFPFNFTGGAREVYVMGEAYFDVATDPAHPFIVHTPAATVTVLGTVFNINSYSRLAVSVVSGEVRVATSKQTVHLTRGQQAIADTASMGLAVESFDIVTDLTWITGLYSYEDITTEDLAKEITRHWGYQVIIQEDSLKKRTWRVTMDINKPFSFFISNMNAMQDCHFSIDNQNVVHVY